MRAEFAVADRVTVNLRLAHLLFSSDTPVHGRAGRIDPSALVGDDVADVGRNRFQVDERLLFEVEIPIEQDDRSAALFQGCPMVNSEPMEVWGDRKEGLVGIERADSPGNRFAWRQLETGQPGG